MDRRWLGMALIGLVCLGCWVGLNWHRDRGFEDRPLTAPILAIQNAAADTAGADPLTEPVEIDGIARVYVFLATHCPISNRFIPTLNRLHEEYGPLGVQFLGVYPGGSVTQPVAERHREQYEITFPVTQDRMHRLCASLGATHTPQAVVVNAEGEIVYSGRIDDRFADLGKKRLSVHHADLQEALNCLVGGREIKTPTTPVVGCVIEVPADGLLASDDVDYCRDVAPILFDHCVTCHRPGEVAPFPLETFDDARDHAQQIGLVTARRLMPPWRPESGFGHFQNDRRLSEEDIATLQAWVEQGTPYGNARDLPPRPQFATGWQLGEPDLVLEMPADFAVPADGPDIYQHFVLPTGVPENRLVRAMEFRPGSPEVVHHALIYYDITGTARELDSKDPALGYNSIGTPGFAASGSLGGWGPGGLPRELPTGMGRPLHKNADIVLQIHYHPNGKVTRDRSRLGLYFAPKSATWEVTEGLVSNVDLKIPAGAKRHLHRAAFTLPVETLLMDATPHMHVLGKEIRAIAYPPHGEPIPLIWIKDWDFAWQDHYVYVEPVRLPAGTRIELECWYDNSAQNPLNPNSPPQTVRWGDNSTDEMGICYFQMTTQTWDDFLKLSKAIRVNFESQWAEYQSQKASRRSTVVP